MRLSAALLILFSLGKSWAQRQMATIYSLANFAGSWSERTENCPDFRTCDSTIGDNVVSSTCVTGIWIFYSERNYNSGDFGTVEWVFGDNYCWNLGPTDNDVSSLRYVGRQDNWKEDAITLYGLTVFAGSAHLDLIDSSNVPMSSVQSIIISGESDWTVYSLPNFAGIEHCLVPEAGMYVGFIPNLSLGGINSVRSYRKGCFSDKKIQLRSDRHGVVVMDRE